ncbi:alpha/beta hydrolase [Nocardioides sp. TRM66260-LWL]|uniref:alpha/beta hydrolase fold domain-containing protein n=1 Tax=Nocardioides sp. TRM66260-LWL TaxID=2874478 RepID=UPI001CC3E936|nr:alpha/beta hydrolase [Nocardioides sp. TRM66260-LWL]MBZ5734757.1 alpha/beta hydrolase [Nocardioides sp. TRM66260-LWL]
MPSLRHQLLAVAVPRLRHSTELDSVEQERARFERWHATRDHALPTRLVPGLRRRYEVTIDHADGFPVHVLTPRGTRPRRTVVWMHGGGFVGGIDGFHVRYAERLGRHLGARIVLPDYPLAPEHTWRDSHDALVRLTARWSEHGSTLLGGDSAGGNLALAVAQSLRDAGGPQADRLLLLAPWVDLTTSTPSTPWFAARDPWLRLSKLTVYAEWWAGGPADLDRPEVSPGLGDLRDLPSTLLLCGTRDVLLPGCRLLAARAAEAGWDLTYREEPGLIHVYPLLPAIPEAAHAWTQTVDFLAGRAVA